LLPIHALYLERDLLHAALGEMLFFHEHLHDLRKELKVSLLCGLKSIFSEERKYRLVQIPYGPHAKPIQMFVMVVIPFVHEYPPAFEERLEQFERWKALHPLGYDELRKYLPSELARTVAEHTDREASFSVRKSHDPTFNSWPFLLISHI
jgi:hypothetical protein